MAELSKRSSSEWTIETLREYLTSRIDANEAAALQRFESSNTALQAALAAAKELVSNAQSAADRAVQKAEIASDKRFEGVNEFRAQLADQQRTLMPRAEVEVLLKAITDRVKAVEILQSQSSGTKIGITEGWGWAVGVVGLVLFVVSIFMYFKR
jgi:hypothetical protein